VLLFFALRWLLRRMSRKTPPAAAPSAPQA
jgi:hypothetical protein